MAQPKLKIRIYDTKLSDGKSLGFTGLIFIIFIILINPFIACTKVSSSFQKKVLNDFDTTSYFIALDIKSPSYNGRTIIENNNLYLFLNKTKGFNKRRYLSFMQRTLTHHRTLKIEEKGISMWKFIKVYDLESVLKIADHGSNYFIENFFNGTVLNYGYTEKEQDAIINQLFYWEIPAKIDKITGDLIIG